VLTLFPRMFYGVLGESIIKRAISSKKVSVHLHDIRDYTDDKHRKVDSKPFGGGPGMVMGIQPVFETVRSVKKQNPFAKVILMSPQGELLNQKKARCLSAEKGLIVISGHYEGVDERIRQLVDSELSVGDYILTGGELPAMTVIDAVIRLIPGVLGHSESSNVESFSYDLPAGQTGLLEYPQYTRPAAFCGMEAPEILLCGNHKLISRWRKQMSILRTMERRPDLIKNIKQIEMGD